MTGYVYQGTRRDLGIDLETANAAILAARDPDFRGPRLAESPDGQCSNGHRRTAANTYVRADGTRRCRDCQAGYRARRKQKAGTP